MKQKIFILGVLVIVLSLLTGCTKNKSEESESDSIKTVDALTFKESYEFLNGKETSDTGISYRSIEIPKDNPIIYSTFEKIANRIENKETFIVYVGFSSSAWSRSVIPYVLESAQENNIDKIYYINVRDDNTRESDLRGYYKLDDNNKVVADVYPDKYYYNVLETVEEFLDPYTLETTTGETIDTGIKRIYTPTFIVYKDGVAVALDDCISDIQTGGYQELTDEMIQEMKDKAGALFKIYNES
jgi:hypothetical protein